MEPHGAPPCRKDGENFTALITKMMLKPHNGGVADISPFNALREAVRARRPWEWAEPVGWKEENAEGRERQMCIIGKCALSG